tara:strand:- start:8957 stop:9112 length:156 start_codon:yes stop_codon:yes gene_type:complete
MNIIFFSYILLENILDDPVLPVTTFCLIAALKSSDIMPLPILLVAEDSLSS